MSGDAYHLKLQAELGVNVARKEAWQFELESLSKVPQTAAQAALRHSNAERNALKYFSAFPVVFLSHLKYSVSSETWHSLVRPCWVACAVANTAYSVYWDVTHDWDLRLAPALARECLGSFRRGAGEATANASADEADDGERTRSDTFLQRKYLRPRLLYGDPNVYFAAAAANAALRLSWTYKLSSHLRHNAGTVLAFTALEITRRFLWSMFRVEKAYLARGGVGMQGLPR